MSWKIKLKYHFAFHTAKIQGMLTPPWHLIPPPVYSGARVSPFVSLTCNSFLCFETDHSLVCYSHFIKLFIMNTSVCSLTTPKAGYLR
jgi:hypothetical protein